MLHTDGVVNVRQAVNPRQTTGFDSPRQSLKTVTGLVRFGAEGLVGFAPGGDVREVVDWGLAEAFASTGFGFDE